jgi:hypothetical protein
MRGLAFAEEGGPGGTTSRVRPGLEFTRGAMR